MIDYWHPSSGSSHHNGIRGGGWELHCSRSFILYRYIYSTQVGGFLASPLVRWLDSLLPSMGELSWTTLAQVWHDLNLYCWCQRAPRSRFCSAEGKPNPLLRAWCWPPPWRAWTRTSASLWKWSPQTWPPGQTTWLLCWPAWTPSMRTGRLYQVLLPPLLLSGCVKVDGSQPLLACIMQKLSWLLIIFEKKNQINWSWMFTALVNWWCLPPPPPAPLPSSRPPTRRWTRWYPSLLSSTLS